MVGLVNMYMFCIKCGLYQKGNINSGFYIDVSRFLVVQFFQPNECFAFCESFVSTEIVGSQDVPFWKCFLMKICELA